MRTTLIIISLFIVLSSQRLLALEPKVPFVRPEQLIEYSERQGAIVHVGSFRPSAPSPKEERQAELRKLIRSTFSALKTKITVVQPTAPSPTKRVRPTRRPTRKPTPKPTPKPIDYTREPNKEGKLLCPSPSCKFWNDLMETSCRFCGEEMRTTAKILKAREERLAKEEEQERLRRANEAMYAGKPTPKPTKAPKPKGPTYKAYGKEIGQLVTPYKNMAINRLVRAGAKALADLNLALTDGDKRTKRAVKGMLPRMFTKDNEKALANSLRDPKRQLAAKVALQGAGYEAANVLFAELDADNQKSANSVIELIGTMGDKALPLLEARLTPEYIRIYPRLGDALHAIGQPSLSLLCRFLRDSEDPYIVELTSDTLARFKEKAAPALLSALSAEGRLERKKRIVETLGKVKSASAIDALSAFVNNSRFELNITSRQALCSIGTERALRVVGELMASGSQKLTERTLDIICQSSGPKVRVFGELVKDRNSRLRIWSLRGMVKIAKKHPEVKPLIEGATKDNNRGVRREAEKALSSI